MSFLSLVTLEMRISENRFLEINLILCGVTVKITSL